MSKQNFAQRNFMAILAAGVAFLAFFVAMVAMTSPTRIASRASAPMTVGR